MAEEIANLLKQLHSAGETGLFILIGLLLVTILIAGVLLFLQRQAMQQIRTVREATDNQIRLLETRIQSSSSLREESLAAVDLVKGQLDAVTETNDDLRKEIARIRKEQEKLSVKQTRIAHAQDKLSSSVSEAITLGLEDIKNRMNQVTVEEILEQIPDKFRQDLEEQISTSSEQIMKSVILKLKSAPGDLLDRDAVESLVSKISRIEIQHIAEQLGFPTQRDIEEFKYYVQQDERIPEELAYRFRNLPKLFSDEGWLDYLANRIAEKVKRGFGI